MPARETVDAILRDLKEAGIKKRTIANNYGCFYRSLREQDGEQELDADSVSSFLIRIYGGDILHTPNSQLSRREQTIKHAFSLLLDYQESNVLPELFRPNKPLTEYELGILDKYIRYCSEEGNTQRTLQRKSGSIKRFLSANDLHALAPSVIQAFLHSFRGKNAYYLKREMDEVKKFLAFCTCQGIIESDLTFMFPSIKATKDSTVPSVFTKDEIRALLLHFLERDSVNRLRDYVMVLLMAVYGLRSIDISHLHLSCINFENETITLTQSKTGTEVCHKILPHVGNVLVEYILNERADSTSTLLFLKSNGDGISSKTVSGVVRNGFLASGISIGARKYGSHSLRHSVASGMINEGYSIFTVANVLGQTSAATARLYARIDLSRLSECALEVPVHE